MKKENPSAVLAVPLQRLLDHVLPRDQLEAEAQYVEDMYDSAYRMGLELQNAVMNLTKKLLAVSERFEGMVVGDAWAQADEEFIASLKVKSKLP